MSKLAYKTFTDGSLFNITNEYKLTNIVEISAGTHQNIVRKSDGTVWMWGANGSGQLGDNTAFIFSTSPDKSSYVAVVGNHSFIQISTGDENTVARKQDGSIWAWGWNGFGELGQGTNIDRSTNISSWKS